MLLYLVFKKHFIINMILNYHINKLALIYPYNTVFQKELMKTTLQFAAQFPAASVGRDTISDEASTLFTYPALLKRLCDLEQSSVHAEPQV